MSENIENQMTDQTVPESASAAGETKQDDEFSAIKNYQFTPPETHDYEDEKKVNFAIFLSLFGPAVSIILFVFRLATNGQALDRFFVPGPVFPGIGLILALRVMKKDKTLKSAKYAVIIGIISLIFSAACIGLLFYINFGR